MKEEYDDIIRNFFTKYVETALLRSKKDYIKKEQKKRIIEERDESTILYDETAAQINMVQESAFIVPWEANAIREYLKQQVDEKMGNVLLSLTDFEILVVFAKVFRQLTFCEIGVIMNVEWKRVASTYSYARKKLKKEWEKNEI